MTKSTQLLQTPQQLRHVAVVGARGHGKTALVHALACATGESGDAPLTTITSLVNASANGLDLLVQLIDTPGSLEDVMEIYAALALADGVVLVVDPAEGASLLLEKVIEQAIVRRKPLALVLNTGEAQPSASSSWYDACIEAVDAVNSIISRTCSTQRPFDEWRLDPARGNVVVGSAVFGWGFPLPCSWDGEHAVSKRSSDSRHQEGSAGILTSEEDTWLDMPTDHSLAESVLDTIVRQMPSPVDAARFVPLENIDGDAVDAARDCDPLGPLVVHIVRLVPERPDSDELLAIGRVLSGTVHASQAVSVITPSQSDTATCVVLPDTALITSARHPSGLETEIPAGNLCVLAGVGKHINKYGVVVACENPAGILETRLLRRWMREATPPSVLRVTIAPCNPNDTTTLVTTLHQLLHVDLASELESDADEVVLATTSGRHLQRCLSLLGNTGLHHEIPYIVSEPYTFFQETVTASSPSIVVAKSPNRHIRLFCTADPLSDTVVRDWTLAEYACPDEPSFESTLTATHGWSEKTTRRLLADPSKRNTLNVLIDQSQETPIWSTMKSHVCRGFEFGTQMGVLCGERVVGMCVDLTDSTWSGWERNWGVVQSRLAMRTGVFASQLLSSPALLEAFLAIEIHSRETALDVEGLRELLALRKGRLVRIDESQTRARALLPTRAIWGLSEAVKVVADEGVVIETILGQYERVEGDPLDPSSPAGAAVRDMRVRKGCNPDITTLGNLPVELRTRDVS